MTREEFKNQFIVNVRIKINNRDECYKFQAVAFEYGAKVHCQMDKEVQEPIIYNICDVYPQYKGKSFATDMSNLVIYDNGTRIQASGFFGLETDKKLITFDDFITAYNSIKN